jgi:hypothetical protein
MADKPEMLPIDTRVTASLHPQNVRSLESFDNETALVLAPTYDAFEQAYRGLLSVHDVRAAAAKDPTLNEAAVVIATADVADRVFTRVAKGFDSTVTNLKKSIAHLEGELTKPVEAQAAQQISLEIRQHISKLPTGERIGFVQRAINGGDHKTCTAILGAPSYLSGLTDEAQAVLLRAYHEKHNRGAAVRLKAMKQGLELLHTRSGLLHFELEKAVGMPPHKVKELKERKQNADRHLKTA